MKLKQAGFTIVELLIAVSIAMVLATVFLVVGMNFFGEVTKSQATAELAIESQALLKAMSEDSRLADSLSTTNKLADANAPSGGWITNDPSNVIIIESPAINSSRDIIYDASSGYPYRNEIIYFSQGKNLFRRVLKNTLATGNIAVTTCPTATSTCPVDRKYTDYLQDLSFTFYDDVNATTADAAIARSVSITVTMKRKIFAKNVIFNNTLRTTLRNK